MSSVMRETGLESTEHVQLQAWTDDEADLQAISLLRVSANPDILESPDPPWVQRCPIGKGGSTFVSSLRDSANRHPVLLQTYVSAAFQVCDRFALLSCLKAKSLTSTDCEAPPPCVSI